MKEEWKVIPSFEDYAISADGVVKRIRDAKTAKAGRTNKQFVGPNGYPSVAIRSGGKTITKYIHSMVLEAFVGPRPSELHQACHNDGNRLNNSLSNLRWATIAENNKDKKKHGTDQVGMKHHMRKISDDDVREIRRLWSQGVYAKDIAAQYGLHRAYVSLVTSGKRWSHII